MRNLLLSLAIVPMSHASGQIPPNWSNNYQQAPNKHHYLNDMEVNGQGDIWLYGIASDTVGWVVGMVVKYSDQGFVLDWAVEFLDIGQLTDIDIDDSNNVYVGTTTYDTIGSTHSNYMTKKISPDGTILWSAEYTGMGPNSMDRASALCVDGQGNVIITGFGDRPDGHFDWYTVKYDANGSQLWVAQHSPPTDFNGTIGGIDITTDAMDNIYVTGESHDTTNGNFATLKYAPDGTQLWIQREGGYVFSQGRVIRAHGDRVYVAGHYTYDELDSTDALVACYDTSGNHLWTTIFNAPPFFGPPWFNGRETVEDLQIDDDGNLYFTGTEFATNGFRDDYMVVKLDPNGTVIWDQHYGGGNGWDDARSMFVDDQGCVFVTGRSQGAPEGISVIHTVKLDASGALAWYSPYTTALYDYCFPGEIRWDGGNFFYVGASKNSTNGGQLFLLGYWITAGQEEPIDATPIRTFPNPAAGEIHVDLHEFSGAVYLSIIDAGGRTVIGKHVDGGVTHLLDLNGIADGMYLLDARSGARSSHGRFAVGF